VGVFVCVIESAKSGIGSTNCDSNLGAKATRRRGKTPRSMPKILRISPAY
jgi:hypothetical protein